MVDVQIVKLSINLEANVTSNLRRLVDGIHEPEVDVKNQRVITKVLEDNLRLRFAENI